MARNLHDVMGILGELNANRGPSNLKFWEDKSDFIANKVCPLLGNFCVYVNENPITTVSTREVGAQAVAHYFGYLSHLFDSNRIEDDKEFVTCNRFRWLLSVDEQRKLDAMAQDFVNRRLGKSAPNSADDAALQSLMPALMTAARKKKKTGSSAGAQVGMSALEDLMRRV